MHWLVKLQLYVTKHYPMDETLKKDTITMSCEVLPALINHMTSSHMTNDISRSLTVLEFAHLNASIIAEEEVRTCIVSVETLKQTIFSKLLLTN